MRSRLLFSLVILPWSTLSAGEWISLETKALQADLVLEVELTLNETSSSPKGPGIELPNAWYAQARKNARISQVVGKLLDPPQMEPQGWREQLFLFSGNSPCWERARQSDRLKTLLFLKQEQGKWSSLTGVEHESGMYSSLNPQYAGLVQAIGTVRSFPEERMRAVGVEQLWMEQRELLRESEEPYLLYLTARFLEDRGSGDIVDQLWGQPGSEDRNRREAFVLATPTRQEICGS